MGKLMKAHNERVERVQNFSSNNKVFILGVIAVIIFLAGGFISNSKKPDAADYRHPEGYSETAESESNSNETTEYTPQWEFSWFDLAIIGIGGGFCTIMIIRERRKARDTI